MNILSTSYYRTDLLSPPKNSSVFFPKYNSQPIHPIVSISPFWPLLKWFVLYTLLATQFLKYTTFMTFQLLLQDFTMHILLYNWNKIDFLCLIGALFLSFLFQNEVDLLTTATFYFIKAFTTLLQYYCRITELPVSKSHNQSIHSFNKIHQFVGPNKNAIKWIKHLDYPFNIYTDSRWNFSAIIYHDELKMS